MTGSGMGWIGKILRVGRVVERADPAPEPAMDPPAGVRGSLQIRHVDAGSCNGCEVEISAVFGPVYDAADAQDLADPTHAATGHPLAGPRAPRRGR